MEFLAQFHPKLVHFPVAFFLGYFVCELIGGLFRKEAFTKAAFILLIFGVLGALASVITGKQAVDAFDYWNKASSDILEHHEEYAYTTLWYFTAVLVIRTILVIKKKLIGPFLYLFIALAAVGAFLIYQTAEAGGKMVYQHGIGTQYKIQQMEKQESED